MWFQRCLPGFEEIRDKGSRFNVESELKDIRKDMSLCNAESRKESEEKDQITTTGSVYCKPDS